MVDSDTPAAHPYHHERHSDAIEGPEHPQFNSIGRRARAPTRIRGKVKPSPVREGKPLRPPDPTARYDGGVIYRFDRTVKSFYKRCAKEGTRPGYPRFKGRAPWMSIEIVGSGGGDGGTCGSKESRRPDSTIATAGFAYALVGSRVTKLRSRATATSVALLSTER